MKILDAYLIVVICITLRFLISDNTAYLVTCAAVGVMGGLYRGHQNGKN